MFPYDAQIAAAVQVSPQSIPDVLEVMQTIDSLCVDGDGLKWFNGLYLQVTQAVEKNVATGGYHDPSWLADLDVRFAKLYFNALQAWLTNASCPGSWRIMFFRRDQKRLARLQFALAGMNAHINHDLALAIVATCKATNITPQHGTTQYDDYTAVNTTLNSLIDTAKKTLHVRLLGDAMPPVSHLEDLIAGWDLAVAREKAWNLAESLSQDSVFGATVLMDAIDGLTTVIGKSLLIPVP